jgi:RecB family exonuclease
MKNTPGLLVGAEQQFCWSVDLEGDESVTVTGTADRVDRHDGRLVITDFKTGRPITRAAAAEHIQLGLYRWVAEMGALGVPGPAVAQLLYVRHDPPAKESQTGARLLQQDTPDVGAMVQPVLEAVAAGLRAEVVPARPGPHCRTCPFTVSCPARPEGAQVAP